MDARRSQYDEIEIIDYQPRYREFFRDLNYAWLEEYFEVEPFDRIILNDPEVQILARGGFVLFARHRREIVGTIAALRHAEQKYELAKLAVAEHARGCHVGRKLMEAAISRAKALDVRTLVLATNSSLKAANHLFQRLGFRPADLIEIGPLPYHRRSEVMIIDLEGWKPTSEPPPDKK